MISAVGTLILSLTVVRGVGCACVGEWLDPSCRAANRSDCRYVAQWQYIRQYDAMDFVITATQSRSKWTGIGFATSPRMEMADVILGWFDQNTAYFMDGWVGQRYSPPVRDTSQDITHTALTYKDDKIEFRFRRPRSVPDTMDHSFSLDMTRCYYFLFPVGGGDVTSAGISAHDETPLTSTERICISTCPGDELPFISYNCDAETICQNTTTYAGPEALRWRRYSGPTPSRDTGATTGYNNSTYYINMEASSPAEIGQSTTFHLPETAYVGFVCVGFAYHMYGQTIGQLQLLAINNPSQSVLWRKEGNQMNQWHKTNVTVLLTSNVTFAWRGIRGDLYLSDIGLDDLQVSKGPCGYVEASDPITTTTTPQQSTFTPPMHINFSMSLSGTYFAKLDEEVKITCTVFIRDSMCSPINVTWTYPDGSQIQDGDDGFSTELLYSFKRSSFIKVLQVSSSNFRMSGIYTCRATYDGRSLSESTYITILPEDFSGRYCSARQSDSQSTCPKDTTSPTAPSSPETTATLTPVNTPLSTTSTPANDDIPTPEPITQIRLVRGANDNEGRVEVFVRGMWGTVCDDQFDGRDAVVFCRMLNWEYGVVYKGNFSNYPDRIWLDDIKCLGNETNINQCPKNSFGQHNCDHDEDVGVSCSNTNPFPCMSLSCDFETLCGNRTTYDGEPSLQWRRNTGGTSSDFTGPSSGYGGLGYYIYMEASDPALFRHSTSFTIPANGYVGYVCISFAYHMYGFNLGELRVVLQSGIMTELIWSLSGNQNDQWHTASVTTFLPYNTTEITWIGIRGIDHLGDIALDNLRVECNECAG